MRTALPFILLLALVGCAGQEGSAFTRPPNVLLTPVSIDDTWRADVEWAAALWADALEGCVDVPFIVADDGGHEVALVQDVDGEAAGTAHLTEGWVEVEDGPSRAIFLVHELGHVLGVGHLETSPSVMRAVPAVVDLAQPISAADIDAVQAVLCD
jgi:hypothetical protein